ncbi:helix-turn-helix domain-containing protein [Streptacidiphilus carbonis]|uniref:helix-turn-helix domain-containing protein n=1 Tax=Streptacidiphilus carbonis TaxID=105422 RepID=UPI0005AB8FE9|nr:GAF domain-containing protein [Streptacidiphilus carbonis]
MGGNGWLAQVGDDPRRRAREIAHAHSAFVAAPDRAPAAVGAGAGVRELVAQSWRRSSDARVAQDAEAPVTLTDADLLAYRAAHPLSRVIGVLRQIVGTAAEDGRHLMAVSDAAGRLLWVEGNRAARARAARINFVEGALWDEAHAGTNAPGTALALDHEVQIFATEHFRQTVQAWTCAAAPIHDPATGRILGVVDLTGGDAVANPYSLALVRVAARACEEALWLPPRAGDPLGVAGPLRPAAPTTPIRLQALDRCEGTLRLADDRTVRLTRRHTELLIMLTLHQDGLTGDQLAGLLHSGEATGSPTTLRVELTRLRRIVGELLDSRPYRLTAPVQADYLDTAAALRRGDLAAAVAGYPGPLLPSSEAPGVVAQRRWLDTQLRASVLADGDPGTIRAWADGSGFNDLQVWERLAAVARRGSPQRAVALARARELREEYGLRSY